MEICLGCQNRVNTGQMGLECGGCNRWYHAKCERVSKKDYDLICRVDDKVMWHCGKCGDILPMVLKENKRLQNELVNLKQEICEIKERMETTNRSGMPGSLEKVNKEIVGSLQRELKSRMEDMVKMNEIFQEKLLDIEKGINSKIKKCLEEIEGTRKEQVRLKKEKEEMELKVSENLGKLGRKIEESSWQTRRDIDGKLETKVKEIKQDTGGSEDSKKCIASLREEVEKIKEGYVKEAVEFGDSKKVRDMQEQVEQLEKERRKKNLIMFNLKESVKSDPNERYKEDERMCHELFSKLGIVDLEIEIVVRLGKRILDRARPLLVKLNQVNDIRSIMQAKSKLKQLDGFGNVYIERDLTKAEREENKTLRRELYKRRDEGKAWFIIRGRKVVEAEVPVGVVIGNRGRTGYAGVGVRQRFRGQNGDQRQSVSRVSGESTAENTRGNRGDEANN